MSQFTNSLGLYLYEDRLGRPILRGDRVQWQLIKPIKYDVGEEFSGETITVPTEFVTDLASIPFPFRNLLPPDGPWVKAAVVHDLLYASKGAGYPGWPTPKVYTRAEADSILNEAMGVVGVPAFKRALIYRAVRIGGGKGWGS